MTDKEHKELLELAANAAGIKIVGEVDKMICQPDHRTGGYIIRNDRGGDSCWNPLTDDGDALRLAVKLGIHITNGTNYSWASTVGADATEKFGDDPYAATRRAIVRAAAEIDKQM